MSTFISSGNAQDLLLSPLVLFLIAGPPEDDIANGTAMEPLPVSGQLQLDISLMQNLMLFLTLKHADTLSYNLTDLNPVFYSQGIRSL